MKKFSSLLLIIYLSVPYLRAQSEHYLSIGLNSGAGGTVQGLFYENAGTVNTAQLKNQSYGYCIPVSIPVMYGTAKWRLGININYEYIHMLMQKVSSSSIYGFARSPYTLDQSVDFSLHLIKVGAIFEYDLWGKNKHTLSLASELGYYSVVKYSNTVDNLAAPLLYGVIGLQASYSLTKGLKLLYGVGLDVQGGFYQPISSETVQGSDVFFQPRITIGIRKDFLLRSKSRK